MKRRKFFHALSAIAAGSACWPLSGPKSLAANSCSALPAEGHEEGTPATTLTGSVREWNGKPTLFVNDEPVYPMQYSLTDCPGGRYTWEELPHIGIQDFSRQGIQLFQVSLYLEQLFSEDGHLDISLLTHDIRGILDVNPNAAIFLRLFVNSSPEWRRQHPEENTQ
jgi:hypothetical protein